VIPPETSSICELTPSFSAVHPQAYAHVIPPETSSICERTPSSAIFENPQTYRTLNFQTSCRLRQISNSALGERFRNQKLVDIMCVGDLYDYLHAIVGPGFPIWVRHRGSDTILKVSNLSLACAHTTVRLARVDLISLLRSGNIPSES
jgi:hypothetical protein